MRTLIVAASIAAIGLPALTLPAMAQFAPPTRRAGLWEMTMSVQTPRAMTNKSQFCTDPTVEKRVSALGQAGPGQNCAPPKLNRTPGGFNFESTCNMSGHATHTKGVATGDFNSAYRLDMVSEMTPPIAGSGQSHIVLDSKWLGPCRAGQKPGDMIMANGTTINMLSMSGRPPPPR